MTPDISCRSLIQIGLQIPTWRTKWQPCKGITVSQAFIFRFKHYSSILHFAVCQLLGWAFLFEKVTDAIDKGKPFDCIYLDFAKAFDKVPHFWLIKHESPA